MNEKKFIPISNPVFIGNEKLYVNDCIETGWVSSNGKYIKEFEERFAEFINIKHAVSCSNGTVALHLAMMAYDIKAGDEIIIPTLTYIATANAVTYCNATPVLVDSEPETWNMDPAKIEEKITSRTKGIIVVHIYGHPVDMDPIMEIAKKYNLFVIEDAAEAHGALYKNKVVGSIGDISTFSFFGNKIITTGEGGMVVTNDEKLAAKIRLLKGQGMDPNRRYWFPVVGYNYRMTNIEAALGLAQLEKVWWHMRKRRDVAELYNRYLSDAQDYLQLPVEKEWAKNAYWIYSIVLKDNISISRDNFMQLLAEDGIETRPMFYPMHVLPPYKDAITPFPVADKISQRGMNIPTHAMLTEDDIKYISSKIKEYCIKYSE